MNEDTKNHESFVTDGICVAYTKFMLLFLFCFPNADKLQSLTRALKPS